MCVCEWCGEGVVTLRGEGVCCCAVLLCCAAVLCCAESALTSFVATPARPSFDSCRSNTFSSIEPAQSMRYR